MLTWEVCVVCVCACRWVRICMYVCLCVYICTCIYLCVYTCTCIFVYIYICVCIYVYICVCVHVYICVHVCVCAGVWLTYLKSAQLIPSSWRNMVKSLPDPRLSILRGIKYTHTYVMQEHGNSFNILWLCGPIVIHRTVVQPLIIQCIEALVWTLHLHWDEL